MTQIIFNSGAKKGNLTARTENPVVLMKTDFEYQPSAYGFLVPKQITLVQYNAKNSKKNMQVNFDYSAFTKTNVEVKVLDDDEEVPQN